MEKYVPTCSALWPNPGQVGKGYLLSIKQDIFLEFLIYYTA